MSLTMSGKKKDVALEGQPTESGARPEAGRLILCAPSTLGSWMKMHLCKAGGGVKNAFVGNFVRISMKQFGKRTYMLDRQAGLQTIPGTSTRQLLSVHYKSTSRIKASAVGAMRRTIRWSHTNSAAARCCVRQRLIIMLMCRMNMATRGFHVDGTHRRS